MKITIQQLIDKLQSIPDKTKYVQIVCPYDDGFALTSSDQYRTINKYLNHIEIEFE